MQARESLPYICDLTAGSPQQCNGPQFVRLVEVLLVRRDELCVVFERHGVVEGVEEVVVQICREFRGA